MSGQDFGQRIAACVQRFDAALDRWLPPATLHPARLHEAMRYSATSGGKRVRPLLIYATAEALQLPAAQVDGLAVAVELIHAYSLIHDDLPAMDDDDMRRGQPSCHRAFDEATAILAGDALQALAFHVLATDSSLTPDPACRLRMVQLLADAIGSRGMAGGQAIDLEATGRALSPAELEAMHIRKTGALIRASVLMVCHARAGLDSRQLESLDRYGKFVGLAYQIHDDILDEIGEAEEMGKASGADRARAKPTYPSTFGLSESQRLADQLIDDALAGLAAFNGPSEALSWLARYMISRPR